MHVSSSSIYTSKPDTSRALISIIHIMHATSQDMEFQTMVHSLLAKNSAISPTNGVSSTDQGVRGTNRQAARQNQLLKRRNAFCEKPKKPR